MTRFISILLACLLPLIVQAQVKDTIPKCLSSFVPD